MGTHPNVPSTLTSDPSTTLAAHIASNPALLGDKVSTKFEIQDGDGNLPFLFKVLSIGTALSIQAHPDKKLAQRLFKEHGDIYKGESADRASERERASQVAMTPIGPSPRCSCACSCSSPLPRSHNPRTQGMS